MLCVWLEDGTLSLRHVDQPQPPQGYALLKIKRAGICNTDLELVKGYYPYTGILGHECVALVIDGPPQLMAERVVVEINYAACTGCDFCSRGVKNHCRQRTVMGIVKQAGCFAEYLVAPVANLVPVPAAVTDQDACFAEPLAAALEVTKQVTFHTGQEVLIIGDGKLGLLIAMAVATTAKPPNLTVVGRHADHLALLTAQFPSVKTIHVPKDVSANVPKDHFDVTIECAGNPTAFELATNSVRPRGTVVMKSTYAGNLSLNAATVVVKELTLIGSRCGPLREAVSLLASGKFDLKPLLTAEIKLEDALQGFELAQKSGALKIQLLPY